MSDYFESDEITKGYDSRIVARIFGYLKPYRGLAALCLLALILSTSGELVIPVIVRRAVDQSLMVSWNTVDQSIESTPEGRLLKLKASDPRLDGKIYLRSSRFASIPRVRRAELESAGLYSTKEYYVLTIVPGDADQEKALARLGSAVVSDGVHAALPIVELRALPAERARALRKEDSARIASNIVFLLASLVIVLLGTFVMIYLASLVALRVMKDLRIQLFGHTATRSLDFLSRQPVGRLVTRLTSDVETINQFFTDVLIAFIKDASVMVGSLAVLFALDWRLALVVSACLPPVLIGSTISRRKARDAFRRQRQWTSKVNSFISERLSGVNVVKLFVREALSRREFESRDRELMKANLGEMYVFATFRPIVDFLATMTSAVVICAGALLFGTHTLSLGTIIAFVNLVTMFYSPIKDLAEKYTLLQSAMAGGERIFQLLDHSESIPDNPAVPMPAVIRGYIEFRKVWFAYKDEDWVLKDLSFAIEPGKMVAIVGYTGAGKTTIANLVPRFWDIQRGEILVDGIPVRDLPLGGLRAAIQPVPQDIFLFSGTIEDNIRLGSPIDDETMKAASRAVAADEFIEALPAKYATQLAEGATNLSQGQRQILSFARVLAHNPSVIILDEATSSVDTETEQLIQRGLEGLLAGKTSLVIAHRLSTIRHADTILVLSRGRIAESGSHDELIARRGLYWNLYRLQYGGAC